MGGSAKRRSESGVVASGIQAHRRGSSGDADDKIPASPTLGGSAGSSSSAFSAPSHTSAANWHQLLALVLFKKRLTMALFNVIMKSQLAEGKLRGKR